MPRSPATVVLLLEGIHPGAAAALAAAGCEVRTQPGGLAGPALAAALTGVDCLGIRSKSRLDRATLAAAPQLMAVGCFCIGVNQVDLAAAAAAGVPVFNAPFSNTRSVAELTIAEVVALARQLGDRSAEMHRGRWLKAAQHCHEVRGKTLGIVGYGHIGAQVGVLAEMLGMRVLAYDIAAKLPLGNTRVLPSLAGLLGAADFVTLHVPATPRTAGLIDAAALAAMRPGSYLINNSRGSVVDLAALDAALARGQLRGAAIDVFPEEPDAAADAFVTPLQGRANVLLTPHIGGSTEEAQAAIGREVAAALAGFIGAGTTAGAVNFPHVDVPARPGTHRVLDVHRNVPGALAEIAGVVADLAANIRGQVLATAGELGYLVMDLDHDVSAQVCARLRGRSDHIRLRVVS